MYNNLMYGNLSLSSYLNTVKGNNTTMYEGMMNPSVSDQMLQKNNLERYMQSDQQQKMLEMGRMPIQNEEQQSIVCLLQQVGLYKELLAQITYQNQMLSRDMTLKQTMGQQGMGQQAMGQQAMGQQAMGQQQTHAMGQQVMGHQYPGMNLGYMSLPGMGVDMSSMSSMANQMGNMGQVKGMAQMNPMASFSTSQSMMNSNGQHVMNSQMNLMQGQPRPEQQKEVPSQAETPMMGMGMNSGNYEIIKSMVMEDLKREAEHKEHNSGDK